MTPFQMPFSREADLLEGERLERRLRLSPGVAAEKSRADHSTRHRRGEKPGGFREHGT